MILSPVTTTLTPYQSRLDSRAPAGELLPTPNVAPVLVGHPTTLSFTGAGPHTFALAPYASDANGDTITYSLTSTRTGITVNATTGVLSVDAIDTSGAITVRLTDGLLASDYAISVTHTQSAGAEAATFIIPADTASRVFNGASATGWSAYGPARAPLPGDIIELATGTHGKLTFNNLVGSASSRIVVRNASGAVATIRKQTVTAAYGGFVVVFNNCRHFTVDGSNGLSDGQYGIKVTYSANSVRGIGTATTNDRLAAFIKMSGHTRDYTVKRVEVDGGYTPRTHTTHYSTAGSGINTNDGSLLRLTGTYAGLWFENVRITECYFHNIPGNAFYVGTNWSSGSLPCRNMEIDHNVVHDTGQDGFTCKAWAGGTNSVHHNDVQYTGMDPRADGTYETHEGLTTGSVNQRVGFSIFDGYADVYANMVRDCGRRASVTPAAHGFSIASVSLTAAEATIVTSGDDYSLTFPFTAKAYNNVVSRCDDRGARLAASSTDAPDYVIYAYCNTMVDNTLDSITSGGNTTGFVKNNIFAGNGTNAPSGTLTAADNLTNASSSALLTNPTGDDYTLLAAQLAVGTVGDPPTNEIPTTDIVGVARSNGAADKGAYERI